MNCATKMSVVLTALLAVALATPANAADRPLKAFILAGQSNMVGWGDSTKLPDDLRNGNDRVLMFLWLQGGGDMKKVDVAKEYLDNLKSLVAAVRKATGLTDLPFIYGSTRQQGIPDDLTHLVPKLMDGQYPAAQWVLKAQFDAQKAIPKSKMVILRDIEKHPANVHYNTAGQLAVGRLFADAYLER